MWLVQIALRRPYTFVVLSLLIALFGIRAALFNPDGYLSEYQYSGCQRGLEL